MNISPDHKLPGMRELGVRALGATGWTGLQESGLYTVASTDQMNSRRRIDALLSAPLV